MNKYVVISSNENTNYSFFLPIVAWMWKKFGWDVISLIYDEKHANERYLNYKSNLDVSKEVSFSECYLQKIEGVRGETITQCSRLYVADEVGIEDNDYLMTSDIDMLPLSDYWNINGIEDKITSWGRDLTDYHYPICYIGMKAKEWKRVMNLKDGIEEDMKRDLDLHPKSKSDKWEEWWQVDQDIITEKLLKEDINRIDRGVATNSHYPKGRIDRGCWEKSLEQYERIDAHLLRPGWNEENFRKILNLILSVFPNENLKWMMDYRDEYIKLM